MARPEIYVTANVQDFMMSRQAKNYSVGEISLRRESSAGFAILLDSAVGVPIR